MTDDVRELIARALSGDLSAAESERLLAACRADETVRAELGRLAVTERLLRAAHSETNADLAAREIAARLRSAPSQTERAVGRVTRQAWWSLFGPRLAWIAAVLVLLGAGGWFAFHTRSVATLARLDAATLRDPGLHYGSGLRPGQRLVLVSGLAEVSFANGATVVLEGPVDFEIRTSASGFLHRGRAVAHVPEKARGFIIDSPRGRLVDLGTEFGISVGDSDETEVHVLDGRVDAQLPGQPQPVELRASEGLHIGRAGTTWLKADESQFVTEMPPRPDVTPNYIHWTFDEGTGKEAHNTGRGLAEQDALLRLSSFSEQGPGPIWTAGKFGGALELDGKDSFAECDYRGIPGRQARTIAAWIRVPVKFNPTQGYAIIGWGHTSPGAAWQMSPNPMKDDGALGRLRIGTGKGMVIGSQDLRDGQWHHVAVVMYGGTRPTTGTHVLLYVDGKLDLASRKSVRDILTDPEGADHGLYVGRNIDFHGQPLDKISGGPFFRGTVDEVFIVAAALSQEQILQLMQQNRMN